MNEFVEQIVDFPVSQFKETIVEVVQFVPQERVRVVLSDRGCARGLDMTTLRQILSVSREQFAGAKVHAFSSEFGVNERQNKVRGRRPEHFMFR